MVTVKNHRFSLALFLISTIFLAMTKSTNAEIRLSILNPGYDGYPQKWTAGNPRNVGTPTFIFYNNESAVGSSFFLNVTVYNVELLRGWAIGLIFDKRALSYVDAWRPADHVFKHIEELTQLEPEVGWKIIAPPLVVDDVNKTHSIIKWGCTYIIPEGETPWSFNGTGTLCQIQFKIIKETSADFCFTFDSNWTALYIFNPDLLILEPVPIEKLILESAYFKYFGIEPRESSDLLDLLLKIGAVVFILMVILISVFMMSRRSKHIKIKRRTTNFNLI